MRSTFFALSALLVPQAAFAALSMTSPVVGTVCSAGTSCNINWNDDGQTPSLATMGASSVGVYAGNTQQQTEVQVISGSVDVSTSSSLQWTPDATIGPNFGDYFIRFTSLGAMDATNTYHLEAFSAMFTLNAMTGTFNSTVQAQVSGISSVAGASTGSVAATGSASATGSPSASGSAAATTAPSSSASGLVSKASVSASKTGASPSASGTAKPNGASQLTSGLAMGVLGVAAAVFASVF